MHTLQVLKETVAAVQVSVLVSSERVCVRERRDKAVQVSVLVSSFVIHSIESSFVIHSSR
jgi:hypothetical protein